MRLFVKRLHRDDAKLIKELETEVAAFLGELSAKIAQLELTGIYGQLEAA